MESSDSSEKVEGSSGEKLEEGNIYSGKVTRIEDYGAFVTVDDIGATGLVHISEISSDFVRHVTDYLQVGDSVKVKVLAVDVGGRRIKLSIKRVSEDSENNVESKVFLSTKRNNDAHKPHRTAQRKRDPNAPMTLEEKIQLFKKISDDKIKTIKIRNERKRSNRRPDAV